MGGRSNKRDIEEIEARLKDTWRHYEIHLHIVLKLCEDLGLNYEDLLEEATEYLDDIDESNKIHDENIEYTRRLCK